LLEQALFLISLHNSWIFESCTAKTVMCIWSNSF